MGVIIACECDYRHFVWNMRFRDIAIVSHFCVSFMSHKWRFYIYRISATFTEEGTSFFIVDFCVAMGTD